MWNLYTRARVIWTLLSGSVSSLQFYWCTSCVWKLCNECYTFVIKVLVFVNTGCITIMLYTYVQVDSRFIFTFVTCRRTYSNNVSSRTSTVRTECSRIMSSVCPTPQPLHLHPSHSCFPLLRIRYFFLIGRLCFSVGLDLQLMKDLKKWFSDVLLKLIRSSCRWLIRGFFLHFLIQNSSPSTFSSSRRPTFQCNGDISKRSCI